MGVLTYLATIKLPLGKYLGFTEYLIVILGASYVKNGLSTAS